MIVIGADTPTSARTRSRPIAAGTGGLLGEQTVQVGDRGFAVLLRCARGLDVERVWRWKTAGTFLARSSAS